MTTSYKVSYIKGNQAREGIFGLKDPANLRHVLTLLGTYVQVLSFDKLPNKEEGDVEINFNNFAPRR